MLRWGIIGAGHIANVFCNALQFSQNGNLQAIASQSPGRAQKLASRFQCRRFYESYAELLSDDTVDAVYIATIHPAHREPVLNSISAGKHVLVEKPIATNLADTRAMIDAAKNAGVFLMEGYMYRCHPQISMIRELIENGSIGKVRLVRSEFGYNAPFDPQTRQYDKTLGGGAILDVGCYPVSFCRLVAGAASGRLFADPTQFKGVGIVGETGVDHCATAVMQFENGVIGEIATSVDCDIPPTAVVYGSEGILRVPNPWLPSSPCRDATEKLPESTSFPSSKLIVERAGSPPEEIHIDADRDLYSYEADVVARHLQEHQAPQMSWDDTLGNMNTLETWLHEVGYHV